MANVICNCLAIGAQGKDSIVGLIYRVEGFPFDILVKARAGNAGTLTWLFIQN